MSYLIISDLCRIDINCPCDTGRNTSTDKLYLWIWSSTPVMMFSFVSKKKTASLSMLTCAAAFLEVEEPPWAPVTFWSGDARLTPTLTVFITVERLGAKRVTVTRDTPSNCGNAVSLRLKKRHRRDKDKGVVKRCLWVGRWNRGQTHSSKSETRRL